MFFGHCVYCFLSCILCVISYAEDSVSLFICLSAEVSTLCLLKTPLWPIFNIHLLQHTNMASWEVNRHSFPLVKILLKCNAFFKYFLSKWKTSGFSHYPLRNKLQTFFWTASLIGHEGQCTKRLQLFLSKKWILTYFWLRVKSGLRKPTFYYFFVIYILLLFLLSFWTPSSASFATKLSISSFSHKKKMISFDDQRDQEAKEGSAVEDE